MGILEIKQDINKYLPATYYFIRDYLRSLRKESKDTKFSIIMGAFFSGFLLDSFYSYDFNAYDRSVYLKDYSKYKFGPINRKYAIILKDKYVFSSFIQNVLYTPKPYVLIKQGQIISLSKSEKQFSTPLNLWDYCNNTNRKIVFKPTCGAQGQGVWVLSAHGVITGYELPKITYEEFESLISTLDDYFVSEYIEQGEFGFSLFKESLNTIRLVTMIDPSTQEPFIARAVQRIGTNDTIPTDNVSRGGLFASIDLDSGILGKAAKYRKFWDDEKSLKWYSNHPNTSAKVEGMQIPHWDEIKAKVLEAAEKTMFCPFIGWDICLDTDGRIVVLEANGNSGIMLFQMIEPLLIDPKIKAFFQYYGVIS